MAVARVARSAIDDDRWNGRVMSDPVPLPYGLTWWLDAATDGRWEGLIVDDYRAVLPLPKMRRYGIFPAYLRPPFTQQLGPFGELAPGDLKDLLQAVPFGLQVALPLHHEVPQAELPKGYRVRRRVNYVLDLEPPFAVLAKNFPKTLQALLRQRSYDKTETIDPEEHARLVEDLLGHRKGINPRNLAALQRIMREVMDRQLGDCYQLREDGRLLASGFFPRMSGRTINLSAVSTPLGRREKGMSRLLALLFARDSGQPGSSFDFEGSELPGVRQYFAKFGGTDEGYYLVEKKLLGG